MRTLADSLGTALLLWAIAWVVVMGAVGAALGSARAGRPGLGFAIAVLVPIPIVGWLIVIGLTSRSGPTADETENPFRPILDGVDP